MKETTLSVRLSSNMINCFLMSLLTVNVCMHFMYCVNIPVYSFQAKSSSSNVKDEACHVTLNALVRG